MGLSLNNQHVVVEFSPPITRADNSATVYAQIFVNGQPAGGPQAVELSPEDVGVVYGTQPAGATINDAVGAAILMQLAATGRTFGARFPEDYVPTVMPPAPSEPPAPAEPSPAPAPAPAEGG